MKRPLVVLALPALLGIVWWSGRDAGPDATAEVHIDAEKIAETRTEVLARVTAAGGARTDETTDFDDGGSTELSFRIPATRVETALGAIGELDGVVVRQQLDVDDAVAAAESVTGELEQVDTCMTALADEIGRGNVSRRIEQCREQLGVARDRLSRSPSVAEDVLLRVVVNRPATTNPALVIAVALLTLALGTLIAMTLRPRRDREVVDVTDGRRDLTLEELYYRRN